MAVNSSTEHPVRQIETWLSDIERCADAGEWGQIEGLLKRLPVLVGRVPIAERRAILVGARDLVEQIRARVAQESSELGDRLATIKTGRQAAASYRATSAMGSDSAI